MMAITRAIRFSLRLGPVVVQLPRESSARCKSGTTMHSAGLSFHESLSPGIPRVFPRNSNAKRWFTAASATHSHLNLNGSGHEMMRNIGIAAHIDAGKTSLTAKVVNISNLKSIGGCDSKHNLYEESTDFMEIEKERGMTIQAAVTHCNWWMNKKDYLMNIIDTPGHVDFSVEVERSLRVCDGAILVLCGVSGVQSQTLTVEKHMRRHNVPTIIFVNKLDREGCDVNRVMESARDKFDHTKVAAGQLSLTEGDHVCGFIDLVTRKAYKMANGETLETDVPLETVQEMEAARAHLIETLAEVDNEMTDIYVDGNRPCTDEDIHRSIRRATLDRTFIPVFMGSAKTGLGVDFFLNAVCNYLPSPSDRKYTGLTPAGESVALNCSTLSASLCCLPFKVQENSVSKSLLTLTRLYQGTLSAGDSLYSLDGRKHVVKHLYRVHASRLQELPCVGPGDIVAIGGIDSTLGEALTDGAQPCALYGLALPESVVSLSVKHSKSPAFYKAIKRFQKEDPTLKFSVDEETGDEILSGVGELQLEVYLERLKREYHLDVTAGPPSVTFRETIAARAEFDLTYEKCAANCLELSNHPEARRILEEKLELPREVKDLSCGDEDQQNVDLHEEPTSLDTAGGRQDIFLIMNSVNTSKKKKRVYARLQGYLEPLKPYEADYKTRSSDATDDDDVIVERAGTMEGSALSDGNFKAIQKGFQNALKVSPITGRKIIGCRVVLTGSHTESGTTTPEGFTDAAKWVVKRYYDLAAPVLLEPIMTVHVAAPAMFQQNCINTLTKRHGRPHSTVVKGDSAEVEALMPLKQMFGYLASLRAATEGQGHYNLMFSHYEPMKKAEQDQLAAEYKNSLDAKKEGTTSESKTKRVPRQETGARKT